MTTKCTGLMGRIFGHKFTMVAWVTDEDGSYVSVKRKYALKAIESAKIMDDIKAVKCGWLCVRCGAVTGEKK